MERITYRITLDAHKNGVQRTLQGFETSDNMSRRIDICLASGGDTYEIPSDNTVAMMYVTTPSATEPSINECIIKDNAIIYDVLPIGEEGITEMQIKVIETRPNGARKVLTSPRFAVEVFESGTNDEEVVHQPTFTALEEAVAKAQAVYESRMISFELTEECVLKVVYADGTIYENDILKNAFLYGEWIPTEENLGMIRSTIADLTKEQKVTNQRLQKEVNDRLSEVAIERARIDEYFTHNAKKEIYSNIVCDGVTDNTEMLLAELEALEENQKLITPKGVCFVSGYFLMGTQKNNVTLDFSNTTFVTDKDTCMILKLKNSTVIGLTINGNRDNKDFDYSANEFGQEYLLKADNNCDNVRFTNTTFLNAPYCAVMLGDNIKNVSFDGLYCENIGEHIFYKTGYIREGYDIENLQFRNAIVKNMGVNSGNKTHGHFVSFLKVANDGEIVVGNIINTVFDNLILKNDDGLVSNSLIGGYSFKELSCNNVKGFDTIVACQYIENAYISYCRTKRIFYTSAITSSKNVCVAFCVFTEKVAHVNFANVYFDCYFTNGFTSTEGADVLQDECFKIIGCKIENVSGNTNINHIYKNVVLADCEGIGLNTEYNNAPLISFGSQAHVENKCINIRNVANKCPNNVGLFYLYGTGLLYNISDFVASNRIVCGGSGVKSVAMTNLLYKFDSGYYTPVLTDTDKATRKKVINCWTDSGTSLDN